MIKAVIVDDESHAREKLNALLKEYEDIEITASCRNGLEAINKNNDLRPDLVFLDIEMPEIDGFRVIENVECDPLPYFVFVTAFSEYAVKAFEVEALDYIHKPLDRDRLQKSIARFLRENEKIGSADYENKIRSVLKERDNPKFLDRFILKNSGEYFLVNADDIFWIKSGGNYIRIVTESKKYFIRYTLSDFENYLDSSQFYRISRSAIVNIDWVAKIEDHYYGNFMVHMQNEATLKMTKNYKGIMQKLKSF